MVWLLQVVILQEKLEEKEDEIRRLKQEAQENGNVEEEQTVVATDEPSADEGTLPIEVKTEN